MVKLKVSAVLQRIKNALTGAFQWLKPSRFQKKKEQKQPERKKREGSKGKTVVKNTEKATVKNLRYGGEVTKPKRKFKGKNVKGTAVARGCGAIMPQKRKKNKRCGYSVVER